MRNLPLIGLAQAANEGCFNEAGHPAGGPWDEIAFPDLGDARAYAVEIGGSALEPVYRDGDIIIVSPQAAIRRGDRVLVRTRDGEVKAKVLRRRSARWIEFKPLDPQHEERTLATGDVDWMARIVWGSQ